MRFRKNYVNPTLTDKQKQAINLAIIRGEGSAAFYAKKSIFDNPYLIGSQQSETWIDAFCNSEKVNANSKIKAV